MTFRLTDLKKRRDGFTLLEVVIVLFIAAMVLTAVHTIANGTLTLADDVTRAQRSDAREQAFTTFCERLFAGLPPTAVLNLKTTQDGGQYLCDVELNGVASPFDGMPDRAVHLFTEPVPGGGVRMRLSCRQAGDGASEVSVILFDALATCEWRAFDPATGQWTHLWSESLDENVQRVHPSMLELVLTHAGGEHRRQVFWVAQSVPSSL